MTFLMLLILITGVLSTFDSNGGTTVQNEDQEPKHETDTSSSKIPDNPVHESLAIIVKKSPKIPHHIRLPNTGIESKSNEIRYPGKRIQHVCPSEDPIDSRNVILSGKKFPDADFCLLDHNWSKDQSKCRREIRPLFTLVKQLGTLVTTCGKLYENRLLYAFGFLYCTFGDRGIHQTPHIRATLLGIYEICLDTYQTKTMWTKHTVQSGFMLKRPGLPSQRTEYPSKFHTHSYGLPETIFSNIEAEYEKQKETNARFNMIPQMLVPQDDLALKLWKKTTHHYLNTAPLWDELVPLMNAINDGIRKAGITIDLRNYKKKEKEEAKTRGNEEKEEEEDDEDEEDEDEDEIEPQKLKQEETESQEFIEDTEDEEDLHTLFVYTTTISHLSQWQRFFNFINIFKKNETFGWNIWCKFIYYHYENAGVMIYLHNLPNNPPEKLYSMQDDFKPENLLRGKECENPIPCDFKRWADEPDNISDARLKYAYCCEVDAKKVDELFSITLPREVNILKIDDIVKEDQF